MEQKNTLFGRQVITHASRPDGPAKREREGETWWRDLHVYVYTKNIKNLNYGNLTYNRIQNLCFRLFDLFDVFGFVINDLLYCWCALYYKLLSLMCFIGFVVILIYEHMLKILSNILKKGSRSVNDFSTKDSLGFVSYRRPGELHLLSCYFINHPTLIFQRCRVLRRA